MATQPRSKAFHGDHEPFRELPSLELAHSHVNGPFSFLNPTQARFRHNPSTTTSSATEPGQVARISSDQDSDKPANVSIDESQPSKHKQSSPFAFQWTSRNKRKGRHTLVLPSESSTSASVHPEVAAPKSTSPTAILQGITRMFTTFPVYDVSYLVATIFTLGSVVWVINAFFVFLPLVNPATEFDTEILYGGGITAFIGATIFEIGSVLLMLEAVNEKREGCFGWAVEEVLSGWEGGKAQKKVVPGDCEHHHANEQNLVGAPASGTESPASEPTLSEKASNDRTWTWWPSSHDLRTHYLHELGFLACLSQLFGATIFWISGFTALPGIYNNLTTSAALNGAYWAPQIIGGCGFIVSSTLFMLETQQRWWKPALGTLGWHIGLWNLVGGVGFTLCPAFGLDTAGWAAYQSSCATFWGSWAFLVGSVVQWYESLDKYPVVVKK